MVINGRNPISVLEQRIDFVEGVVATAVMCNWKNEDIDELRYYVNDRLVYIDRVLHTIYTKTKDKELAQRAWEGHMEDLRHWLSLVLGIKIRYV